MNKSVYCAIRIGSPDSSSVLVDRALRSIIEKLGATRLVIGIALGDQVGPDVRSLVRRYIDEYKDKFDLLSAGESSWASFINEAIERAKGTDIFIKAHDDIELVTDNVLGKLDAELRAAWDSVGWVSLHDIGWEGGDFAPSTRPGYHIDVREEGAWRNRKVFQFNTFPDHWWRARADKHLAYKLKSYAASLVRGIDRPAYPKPACGSLRKLLKLPTGAVICHAPFNHFVLISTRVLNDIGKCEDWGTNNALLVDEDWGLRSHLKGYTNLWVSSVEYIHRRGSKEGGGTRSAPSIARHEARTHRLFAEKWKFNASPSLEQLRWIESEYGSTLIPWSIGKRSYDWEIWR